MIPTRGNGLKNLNTSPFDQHVLVSPARYHSSDMSSSDQHVLIQPSCPHLTSTLLFVRHASDQHVLVWTARYYLSEMSLIDRAAPHPTPPLNDMFLTDRDALVWPKRFKITDTYVTDLIMGRHPFSRKRSSSVQRCFPPSRGLPHFGHTLRGLHPFRSSPWKQEPTRLHIADVFSGTVQRRVTKPTWIRFGDFEAILSCILQMFNF